MKTMNRLAELRTKQGFNTVIGFDFDNSFEAIAMQGGADCFIVSTEDGFSPLGAARTFFARETGVEEKQISEIANWNRFENPQVSLVAIRSARPKSLLRGVILAASETSRSYEQFAVPRHGRPYRDFYYNVSYEAIAYAHEHFGARRLAMSHLSGSGNFHEDIATCAAEALAHYTERQQRPSIESFTFVGCCIDRGHLTGIARLNSEGSISRHMPITVTAEVRDDFEIVTLQWKPGGHKVWEEDS